MDNGFSMEAEMLAQTDYPRSPLPAIRQGARRSRLLAIGFVAVWLCGLIITRAQAQESNWPQWRGPLMTGVSPTADPPVKWSETSNIKWKAKIPGRGLATALVWGEQVFVQTAIPVSKAADAPDAKPDSSAAPAKDGAGKPAAGDGKPDQPPTRRHGRGMGSPPPTKPYQFVLLCLDRRNGRTLWQKVAREEIPHEGAQFDNTFASYSPVTDGKLVIAYFGSRGLHCYDMQGNLKWEKDLGRMKTKLSFGEGSSPVLFGNTVVVNWDNEGPSFIVALDKGTGNELWRTPRDEQTSWSTPVVIERSGKAEVVTAATHKIRSYDLASGKLLWECSGLTTNAIPSPVFGKDLVFATTGFRGHVMLAIRPGGTGDVTGTDSVAWTLTKGTPYVPSPLLYDERLYFFSGNTAILSCVDANSGHALYDDQRVEGLQGVYASPVGAAGKVYLVGRNGTVVVIKHADKFEILATNSLDEQFDASPSLAGKELFLRGREYLYCVADTNGRK
jgi:outer membrane protein assembly factor BamB